MVGLGGVSGRVVFSFIFRVVVSGFFEFGK